MQYIEFLFDQFIVQAANNQFGQKLSDQAYIQTCGIDNHTSELFVHVVEWWCAVSVKYARSC